MEKLNVDEDDTLMFHSRISIVDVHVLIEDIVLLFDHVQPLPLYKHKKNLKKDFDGRFSFTFLVIVVVEEDKLNLDFDFQPYQFAFATPFYLPTASKIDEIFVSIKRISLPERFVRLILFSIDSLRMFSFLKQFVNSFDPFLNVRHDKVKHQRVHYWPFH